MLNLPSRTKQLLESNPKYHGFVISSISKLKDWLADNKTIFFPEYTDHGFTHLNEVLLTADSLISDESWLHLTPQDTAAMVISVLLHDCAMHISEDGFYTIINDQFSGTASRYIDKERKWSEVWIEFIAEAKRFDARKLHAIFGDQIPIRDIPQNKIDLSHRDKLLIGEFVRRNHARIAHEIALYGVPGSNGNSLKFPDEPEIHFLDLCGLIARSHNMDLRKAVDKIEKNKKQIHLGTHVPFIMLVLRISDFIQIHSERAPKNLLSIKTLISPISIGEWKKHHSIVEINQAHEDPEAIYVDAEPLDAITYESLVSLFHEIQRELDLSWSVLGEVYGRYPPLHELAITIRRIRSSLDNTNEFIKTKKPKYIPKVLKFKTADTEMMDLLITPLYGDKPEIGVRELIQNSIDACIELKDLQVKQQIKIDNDSNQDVCVTLIDNKDYGGEIIIEDYGIGMTLDVIENYFLNIGASFRNSDRWKKYHETQGHSTVYRTGRFGIGLLAAYLLGDEIEVETRHATEEPLNGLKFSCKKGSQSIVVSNIQTHIGTKITIKTNKSVTKHLVNKTGDWDWFSLSSPKVIRKIITNTKETILDQSRTVPNSNASLDNSNWYRTTANGYDDIMWTYQNIMSSRYHPFRDTSLICNGIVITDNLYINDFDISEKIGLIRANTPTLVVFDQDGRLPINLNRSGLVGKQLPFTDEISSDISKYLAKNIIDYCKTLDHVRSTSLYIDLLNIPIIGLSDSHYGRDDNVCKFIISENSLLPMDFDLIAKEKIESLYIDAANLGKGQGAWNSQEFLDICSNYLIVDKISHTKQSRSNWIRKFFELYMIGYTRSRGISSLPIIGRRILIKKDDIAEIVSPGYVPKTFWNKLTLEFENNRWQLLSIGTVPKFEGNILKLVTDMDASNSFEIIFCYLKWDNAKEEELKETSLFSQAWLEQNNHSAVIKQ